MLAKIVAQKLDQMSQLGKKQELFKRSFMIIFTVCSIFSIQRIEQEQIKNKIFREGKLKACWEYFDTIHQNKAQEMKF